jgi:FkbM family methyltransferase
MSKRHAKPMTLSRTPLHPRLLMNGYVSIKQCRHGLFMYNLNDLFVGRGMDIYGEWCEAELACLGQILKSGDVVIDVGANIGTHTVFFSKKVAAEGMVYAFEPQRITFEFLCANLALNGLLNVVPLQNGAGDQLGEIIVPVLNPSIAQNFAALKIEGHAAGDLVKVLPLDALELKRCNLIKIDVEGMELKVLQGAEKTIRDHRPLLFVENNNREGAPELVQTLFDMGYKCWWHIAAYYNPDNFFHNKENVWANFVPESNMICVPKESNLNVTGFETVISATDTWVQALNRLGLVKSETTHEGR